MKQIKPSKLNVDIVRLWDKQWFLLTAGIGNDFNMMTVSWGSIGCLWNKPFAQVVVRPQRYTYQYMEKYPDFTLCAFPDKYHSDLRLLGTLSGRDGDKLSRTVLTAIKSQKVAAPSYQQAALILECRKMYWQDMNPGGFIDQRIERNYPIQDYHRIYFGEILTVLTDESFG
jgi:flavin reductase (DIM6/NTAB) family NADH-FMN oxidoreductase RutF